MKMNPAFRPATLIMAALILAALGAAVGCTLYQMERDLPEKYAAFLSDVRYLITSAERKTFLAAPDSAKDRLIEEFWMRRDPDPDTVDNEVRTEYNARISQANEMFRMEGVKGWLSDRGRIFVLYGPPDEQRVLTMAETSAGNCREIWYYNGFPVTFLDEMCTGNYRLVTFDLTPIKNLSLNQPPSAPGPGGPAGPGGRPGAPGGLPGQPGSVSRGARPILDFTAEIRATVRRTDRVEGVLHLEVPIRLIWFKSEGGRFLTTFAIFLRVRDSQKGVVWEKTDSAEANYPESEIQTLNEGVHVIEIPIVIGQAESVARIASGPATIDVRLTNQTGSEAVSKTIDWK